MLPARATVLLQHPGLLVVLIVAFESFLPLLLFHRIVQEHADKHRVEGPFLQRAARRDGDFPFLDHLVHPDLLIRRDQNRDLN